MQQLRTRLDDRLSYELLEKAHNRAAKGKRNRRDVLQFEANRASNLFRILDVLIEGSYLPSAYWKFKVYDPKERLILALPYPDRIIHQWYIEEFIKPYYMKRFISDSYACIPGKGLHRAVDKIQEYMQRMDADTGHFYIIKMDISKFFYNIDLVILFDILQNVIRDAKLLELTRTIIFDDGEHDGLPIGNYVSQYFANIYLNELDQFCKHCLGIHRYVRYMDDFIALAPSRSIAKEWYEAVDQFVNENLHLPLNPKSTYYPGWQGVNFVGYVIHEDFRLIRDRSKQKIRQIIKDYCHGEDDEERFIRRVNSWYGHVQHADSWNYTNYILKDYRDKLPVIFGS